MAAPSPAGPIMQAPSQPPTSGGHRPPPLRPHDLSDWFILIVGRVSFVCGLLSAAALAVSVLIVCQLVFMRYVLNASTVWQTELVIYLMIAATLIGMPYVQSRRGHVNVDLLPLYLGRRARAALYYLCLGLGLAVCALVVFYGVELTFEAYIYTWRSPSIWRPPLWIPYLALPVGFGLMFLQLAADLVACLTGREKPFGLPDKVENPLAVREVH
jgi:TRAP-type C4-dicarboxylate transport system permease small subunit